MGMASVPARGTWTGDTLTFESSMPGGKGRYSYRFEGKDKHFFRIENSFDGGATWVSAQSPLEPPIPAREGEVIEVAARMAHARALRGSAHSQ
jgi:hypothetical protein